MTRKPKNDKGLRKDMLRDINTWRRNEGPRTPGGQPGNTSALKHGIFANRFLDDEEKPLFDAVIAALNEDFTFNRSSDMLQVELVAVNFVKLARSFAAGDYDAAEKIDRMIRQHLRDLKATKVGREGEEKKNTTTPADWATNLLERIADAKDELSGGSKNEEKSSENAK